MAEYDTETTTTGTRPARGHRPDLLTLIAGVVALFASTYILTDGAIGLPSLDPRWLIAGGALLVGLLLLGASLRGGNRNR
ncbi:MAG: hypothetical protein ACRDQ5_24030 [Sciscionella sp.]